MARQTPDEGETDAEKRGDRDLYRPIHEDQPEIFRKIFQAKNHHRFVAKNYILSIQMHLIALF